MGNNIVSRAIWIMAVAMICLGVGGCRAAQGTVAKPATLPEACHGLVVVSPEGHFLLNRSLVSEQNVDRINQCLLDLEIPNVRMARDIPCTISASNQT